MTPPPLADVLDAVQQVVLPAAGAAALVFAAVLAVSRRLAAVGAALAVFAGLAAGNWAKTPMPWFTGDSPWHNLPAFTAALLTLGVVQQLLIFGRWPVAGEPPRRQFVVVLHGLLRFVIFGLMGTSSFPADASLELPVLAVAFGALIAWFVLDRIAEAGHPAESAALQALIALLGGGVFLYAHSARFLDISTILGAAMAGVAVVAATTLVDTRGATPAFVALMPALLVNGRALTSSDVPAASFVLVGVAPLALLPWAFRRVRERFGRWGRVLRLASVLVPLVVALALAARYESLPWEEAW